MFERDARQSRVSSKTYLLTVTIEHPHFKPDMHSLQEDATHNSARSSSSMLHHNQRGTTPVSPTVNNPPKFGVQYTKLEAAALYSTHLTIE
jgi:hypothetical protein